MILSYCHNSSTLAAPNLLNHSSFKSLFALSFQIRQLLPAPGWAVLVGQPVAASGQAFQIRQLLPAPGWAVLVGQPVAASGQVLQRLQQQPDLMQRQLHQSRYQGGQRSCPYSSIDILHQHHVLGICQKPMSAIRNNMSCSLEVNWV
jgi:hypothetical protein